MDCGIGPALAKLPERCVSREPTSGRLVLLLRGRQDFQYISGERSPDTYNRALGLSYEQVEAMEYGVLFGFDAELADPDRVRRVREELGLPVGPIGAAPIAPVSRPAPRIAASSAPPEDIGNFAPWFQEALARGPKQP